MIAAAWFLGPAFNLARYLPTTKVTPEGVCISNLIWPSIFWYKFTSVVVCVVYFIFPLTLISILYLWIYLYLRKKASRGSVGENSSKQADKLSQAKDNVLRTLIFLSLLFFICWVWNICFFLAVTFGAPLSPTGAFYDFSVYMTNVNCCVNPFCYALQYREFQMQARHLFCKKSGPQLNSSSSISVSTLQSTT